MAIFLYIVGSLTLSLTGSVLLKLNSIFAVCMMTALGPVSYLSWLAAGLYLSNIRVLTFYVSGYIIFSAIALLFFWLSLRRGGRFRLHFGIVGIIVWVLAGLSSFYPLRWM